MSRIVSYGGGAGIGVSRRGREVGGPPAPGPCTDEDSAILAVLQVNPGQTLNTGHTNSNTLLKNRPLTIVWAFLFTLFERRVEEIKSGG